MGGKGIYVRYAYFLKAQLLLVMMTPSISVNSVIVKAPQPKSSCRKETSCFSPFSEQSGTDFASSEILVHHQHAEVKNLSMESIDHGIAEIVAIQFRG